MEYKQLNICTKNVHYCSPRPKAILPIPKTKEEDGKIDEMYKELGGLELVFEYKDRKVTKSKPFSANP